MKILILNTVMVNGGDRAILEAEMELLRHAFPDEEIEFTVFDDHADVALRYYPNERIGPNLFDTICRGCSVIPFRLGWFRDVFIRFALWRFELGRSLSLHSPRSSLARFLLRKKERACLETIRNSDLIVSTGGTYLVENYGLLPRFFHFSVARKEGRPYILYTQSLGPFKKRKNLLEVRDLIFAAKAVLLRDQLSMDHLVEAGVDTGNCSITSDAVFAFADEKLLQLAAEREVCTRKAPLVAISVRRWSYFKTLANEEGERRLVTSIRLIIEEIVSKFGGRVVLISTCQGIAEYRHNDSNFAKEIADGLSSEIRAQVSIDEAFHSPAELMQIIDGMDYVISMRMHMCILSLCCGKVVFPIAYEFKTIELFHRLGFSDWVMDLEEIDPNRALERFHHVLDTSNSRRQSLFSGVLEQRREAFSSAGRLGLM